MAEFSVKEVADKLGCSGKTVQRIISDHPEIGVVMVARKPTKIDERQAAQVADFYSKRQQGLDKPARKEGAGCDTAQSTIPQVSDSVSQVSAPLSQVSTKDSAESVTRHEAELMVKVAKLEAERDAAEQRVRDREAEIARLIEEHDKERVRFSESQTLLSGLNDDLRHRLEDAETKAARALEEVDSYKPSLFGFYRKK